MIEEDRAQIPSTAVSCLKGCTSRFFQRSQQRVEGGGMQPSHICVLGLLPQRESLHTPRHFGSSKLWRYRPIKYASGHGGRDLCRTLRVCGASYLRHGRYNQTHRHMLQQMRPPRRCRSHGVSRPRPKLTASKPPYLPEEGALRPAPPPCPFPFSLWPCVAAWTWRWISGS